MLVAVTLMEFIAAGQNGSILEKIEGRYRIRIQNQFLEIDPSTGGRITSLVLNGQNFLTGRDVNDFNWGSTFWISPQSALLKQPNAAALMLLGLYPCQQSSNGLQFGARRS